MSTEHDPGGAAGPRRESGEAKPASESSATRGSGTAGHRAESSSSESMLPRRRRARMAVERLLVRLVATGGIVGIGVAIGAIMVSSNSQGWLIGLVVSVVSVVLAAILWSKREL